MAQILTVAMSRDSRYECLGLIREDISQSVTAVVAKFQVGHRRLTLAAEVRQVANSDPPSLCKVGRGQVDLWRIRVHRTDSLREGWHPFAGMKRPLGRHPTLVGFRPAATTTCPPDVRERSCAGSPLAGWLQGSPLVTDTLLPRHALGYPRVLTMLSGYREGRTLLV